MSLFLEVDERVSVARVVLIYSHVRTPAPAPKKLKNQPWRAVRAWKLIWHQPRQKRRRTTAVARD